jgi:ornithine cyclodeaminase/alanine dehydrogenase-like protein (mu-crystallin family)
MRLGLTRTAAFTDIIDHAKVALRRYVDKKEVALKKKYLKPDRIHAELGEVIAGLKPGRACHNEISVMDSTGIGIQDAAAGLAAYRLAKEKAVGTWIELT